MDLEEIFNINPAVLEQLLEQPLQEEEPPQHNLVDVTVKPSLESFIFLRQFKTSRQRFLR